MTDRELLGLAAKAAGYSLGPEWDAYKEGICVNGTGEGDGFIFRPLTDDGDALRLAVLLSINIYNPLGRSPSASVYFKEHDIVSYFNETGLDAAASTRRAIVRAAAEIGKSK